MPLLLHRWLIAFFLIGLYCISIDAQHERINPYKVLELSRSASADDIKRAYKRLAKKWHPDKNSDPEAHAQFLQVSAAYDILGDDKKKQEYDSYGHTHSQQGGSGSGGVHPQHPYYHYYQQMDDYTRRYNTYHSIHHHGDGQIKLTASNWDHLVYCNDGIDGDIIWLVYFYGDHCSHCVTTLPAWNEVYTKLQAFNDVVRVGKVQTDFESTLVRKLGVRTLPTIHAYVIRNGQQQRQHTYMQRQPITASSILDWVGNIIEWEGKEESKIYILHKGVTSATDIVPQLQFRRTQHAQQHPHHVIFYILTVRSRPILLHRYLSQHLITHLHKDVRLVHVCLHCITPDVTEQARVAQHVWHVDPLIYKQQAPAPIIVVGREDGTADQVISPVASDFDGLLPQLVQHQYMYIPRLDDDNYYDLCWNTFTTCLIAVTDTVDAARDLLLPVILHDSRIYGNPQSTSSSIHTGWISKGQQSRWLTSVATATGRRSDSIRVILIRPKDHQVMIFDGPKQHLIQWVDASLSKEQWISAARHGGLPFLVPSPRPIFSSWRLPSLNLSPQTIASLTELGPLLLTLMFLVLMFFVSAFIRIA